ncbi:hypothetical protein VP1G_08819 [Cytospora mali]|uniref:Uncharacterized protein n=1 Tax=Cytospora mali TaxID=578113 RepID=A0A194VCD4_CYTMA|nr:hypothetical protein VP1G_08819 [Valsa mali var. pyri (nom. inval.)]
MAPKNPHRRAGRRTARNNMDLSDQEADYRRANTSSEDEGDPDFDATTSTDLVHVDPAVTNFIDNAAQQIGNPHADGVALASAAIQQQCPQAALQLLAAATAKASIDTQQLQSQQDRTNQLSAHAVATADLASEGLCNSDVTYDNRYKRQNTINEQNDQCINALENRLARLEGLLSRVLTMLLNNNVDANHASHAFNTLLITGPN